MYKYLSMSNVSANTLYLAKYKEFVLCYSPPLQQNSQSLGMRLFLQPANNSITRPSFPSEQLSLLVCVTSDLWEVWLSAGCRNTQTNSAHCRDVSSSHQSPCYSITISHPWVISLLPEQSLSPKLQSAYSGQKNKWIELQFLAPRRCKST